MAKTVIALFNLDYKVEEVLAKLAKRKKVSQFMQIAFDRFYYTEDGQRAVASLLGEPLGTAISLDRSVMPTSVARQESVAGGVEVARIDDVNVEAVDKYVKADVGSILRIGNPR